MISRSQHLIVAFKTRSLALMADAFHYVSQANNNYFQGWVMQSTYLQLVKWLRWLWCDPHLYHRTLLILIAGIMISTFSLTPLSDLESYRIPSGFILWLATRSSSWGLLQWLLPACFGNQHPSPIHRAPCLDRACWRAKAGVHLGVCWFWLECYHCRIFAR